ncbi:MAG TPA: hypothetical protein G4N92_05065 [Anaerolineae bacterium]|nr:hypothetical protein [Anaerolineae bacterium]
MSDNKNRDKKTKTTSEKPVSLHPLEFEEALKILLKTPPPTEEKKENKESS